MTQWDNGVTKMEEMIYLPALMDYFKDQRGFKEWANQLPDFLADRLRKKHGDSPRWEHALLDMPEIKDLTADLKNGVILTGKADSVQLKDALKRLMPWRKGPFQLNDILIDTEWRSDFKWNRVNQHIDVTNKNILDVGCGNGYYGYRMLGAGAKSVVGIDPNWLFLYQFLSIRNYMPQAPIWQLPMTLEEMPTSLEAFDMVFSMGVFYHRRSPIDHLYQLKDVIRSGGELVLETIVIDGDERAVLMPKDRYAQMRNVWYLPSVAALKLWLERAGFIDVECVDLSKTTIEEQRTTEWMDYLSLPDFLDPYDQDKTVEGYPAPKRAVMVARKPK